jgi:F0F1-type ATP synthase assembly protein I
VSLSVPTGLVAHVGVALILAYLLNLHLVVTVVCALLPDLVDKPLTAALNIMEGRYIAHTLLFVVGVALAFSLWKRRYGLAALVGGLSHLLLDLGPNNPIFFPFVRYDYHTGQTHYWNYLANYLTWHGLGVEVMFIVFAASTAFLLRRLYRGHRG